MKQMISAWRMSLCRSCGPRCSLNWSEMQWSWSVIRTTTWSSAYTGSLNKNSFPCTHSYKCTVQFKIRHEDSAVWFGTFISIFSFSSCLVSFASPAFFSFIAVAVLQKEFVLHQIACICFLPGKWILGTRKPWTLIVFHYFKNTWKKSDANLLHFNIFSFLVLFYFVFLKAKK